MSLIETEMNTGVLTVTLNDPENRNTLSSELTFELVETLDAADNDPEVRVIVLTNTGRIFCAGADLSQRSKGNKPSKSVNPLDLFGRFRKSPKPYIGRIAGHCVAGGMGLAAAMDLSVVIEDAKFGFTEVRIGVAPAMISVLCLPKMRPAEAAEAMLLGNRMTGADAARLGLVNQAVPAEKLDAVVQKYVADLLAGGPNALAATKQLLVHVPEMDIDSAFEWTSKLSADLFQGDEAKEGMEAFLSKRPPNWIK